MLYTLGAWAGSRVSPIMGWVTHPQEVVQFPHGHLLGSVHSLEHLLLMLLREERDHLGADCTEALHDLSLTEKQQAAASWMGWEGDSHLHHPDPSWTEHLWS